MSSAVHRDDERARVEAPVDGHHRADVVAVVHRCQQPETGVVAPQHLGHRPCLELVGRQVDDIHVVLRVIADVLRAALRAQVRVAQRHHTGIVLAHALDRARAQPDHHAGEAVLAAQLRIPDEWVAAVGHAGRGREVQVAVALALHHLQQDRHPLVEVEDLLLLAIQQHVRIVDARIHARDGFQERSEVVFERALVGAEDALVHAGER